VDGSPAVSRHNWQGVVMDKGTPADTVLAKVASPFAAAHIRGQPAPEAYGLVLQQVGASLNRDALDQRLIREVQNRTGRIIDVQGGHPHGTPYAQTAAAWPALKSPPVPRDTDQDGMPDAWEKKNKLNPHHGADATHFKGQKEFTNIEVYLNGLLSVK
jgi:hypothetical protein